MPLPTSLRPLERESSREIIYRQLKGLILNLTLQPLEVLRDTQLAAQLGVSRTPVREALRKLEDEGYVESSRHQWTRVSGVEPRHVLEMYPVAQALHVTALRLVFDHITDEDLRSLRHANEAMASAIGKGRPADALRFDAAFHEVIVRRAGNPILSQFVTSITERLQRVELAHFGDLESGSVSAAEHRKLIRAIRARNLELAATYMAENWEPPVLAGNERTAEAGGLDPTATRMRAYENAKA